MENVQLLAEFDWSQTELGAIEDWPVERRAVVQTALGSLFPIWLAWGDDLVQIYNDGYNRIYGDKHPGAFGAKAVESWPEIWEFLKPALDRVKAEKQAICFTIISCHCKSRTAWKSAISPFATVRSLQPTATSRVSCLLPSRRHKRRSICAGDLSPP